VVTHTALPVADASITTGRTLGTIVIENVGNRRVDRLEIKLTLPVKTPKYDAHTLCMHSLRSSVGWQDGYTKSMLVFFITLVQWILLNRRQW
jgi:hypothetical protein